MVISLTTINPAYLAEKMACQKELNEDVQKSCIGLDDLGLNTLCLRLMVRLDHFLIKPSY